MPEIVLDPARVVSGIGERVPAGVSEHVNVDWEGPSYALESSRYMEAEIAAIGRRSFGSRSRV